MLKKKCSNCGIQIEKEWNFCPGCGMPLKRANAGVNNTADLNKMVQQMVGPMLNTIMGSMFNPQPQPQQRRSQKNPFEKRTESVDEVIEPEESVTEMSDSTAHVIPLPGVKSKSDINVIKMENSIEVRARSGKRLYLKILKREKGEGVLSEEFSKGNLVIVIKKR